MSSSVTWITVIFAIATVAPVAVVALVGAANELHQKLKDRSERNCSPVPPPDGTRWNYFDKSLWLLLADSASDLYSERVYAPSDLRKASEAILRSYKADREISDNELQIRARVEAVNKAAGWASDNGRSYAPVGFDVPS